MRDEDMIRHCEDCRDQARDFAYRALARIDHDPHDIGWWEGHANAYELMRQWLVERAEYRESLPPENSLPSPGGTSSTRGGGEV